MRQYTKREVERALRNAGYSKERMKGSHCVWSHPYKPSVTISGQHMEGVIIQRLVKEYHLSID